MIMMYAAEQQHEAEEPRVSEYPNLIMSFLVSLRLRKLSFIQQLRFTRMFNINCCMSEEGDMLPKYGPHRQHILWKQHGRTPWAAEDHLLMWTEKRFCQVRNKTCKTVLLMPTLCSSLDNKILWSTVSKCCRRVQKHLNSRILLVDR